MKIIKSIKSRAARGNIFAAPLALFAAQTASFGALLALFGAGCSMVDAPPGAVAPENDVRNYYIQLDSPKVVYNYAVVSKNNQFVPTSGTLAMTMQGFDTTENGVPVYSCLWNYQSFGIPAYWYYSLSALQAINMGVENPWGQTTDFWVDLQAPLALNSTWTFTSQGEKVTATIVKYGAAAQVEGQAYDNVVMVNYSGDSSTTGTEWFQRGKGLIYYNVTRPHSGMVENKLLSIE